VNVLLALPALAALALASPPSGVPARPTPDDEACGLLRGDSATASVQDCLGCHAGSGSGHPVGMRYAPGGRGVTALRSEAEVIRAGVFLPDGELRCTTCHDGRSQVAYRLALPPGAAIHTAVVPGVPSTYASRPIAPAALAARGQQVSPKPLCLACHAF
jgi:hypothetical protein